MSPAAEEVASRAGVPNPNASARPQTWRRLAGLRLSAATVARTTAAAGQRVVAGWRAGQTFGPQAPWAWHQDAAGKTVAAVAAEATGVGPQGPGGGAAEGRRANGAVLDNPVPESRAGGADPEAARRPAWPAR